MSRHWRPDRSDWTVIENYSVAEPTTGGGALLLVLGVVVLGLAAAAFWLRWA